MMKNLLAVAISSVALLIANGALADGGPAPEPPPPPPVYEPPPPPEYNWYTTIFAGPVFGGDLDTDVTIFDPIDPAFDETFHFTTPLNTGWLLGWTVGYRPMGLFGSDWFTIRPEAELSYRPRDVDFQEIFPNLDLIDFNDNGVFDDFSDPASVLSLMFNGWIDFTFDSFTPYIGGGIGVGWSKMPTPGFLLPHISSTDFAWQVGGGFNFDLSDRVFIGVGYRFFHVGFDKDINILFEGPFVPADANDDILLLEAPINFDFNNDTHEVLFNLGVRF